MKLKPKTTYCRENGLKNFISMQRLEEVRNEMCKLDQQCTFLVQALPQAPPLGSVQRRWVEKAREATEYPQLLKEAVALDEVLMASNQSTTLPDSSTTIPGLPSQLKEAGLEPEVQATQVAAAAAFHCLPAVASNPLYSDSDIVF